MNDTIPPQALNLIKSCESCRLKSYQDGGGVWTAGWGATGPDIGPGTVWTQEQADDRLLHDAQAACNAVQALVTVPLNDNQLSALVCFVFNIGSGNFAGSTLLRMLNAGFYGAVPAQLERWNRIHGVTSLGLTRRRQAEVRLWNQE